LAPPMQRSPSKASAATNIKAESQSRPVTPAAMVRGTSQMSASKAGSPTADKLKPPFPAAPGQKPPASPANPPAAPPQKEASPWDDLSISLSSLQDTFGDGAALGMAGEADDIDAMMALFMQQDPAWTQAQEDVLATAPTADDSSPETGKSEELGKEKSESSKSDPPSNKSEESAFVDLAELDFGGEAGMGGSLDFDLDLDWGLDLEEGWDKLPEIPSGSGGGEVVGSEWDKPFNMDDLKMSDNESGGSGEVEWMEIDWEKVPSEDAAATA
jgi:hypothetical protein